MTITQTMRSAKSRTILLLLGAMLAAINLWLVLAAEVKPVEPAVVVELPPTFDGARAPKISEDIAFLNQQTFGQALHWLRLSARSGNCWAAMTESGRKTDPLEPISWLVVVRYRDANGTTRECGRWEQHPIPPSVYR